jgi:pilus assembly protein FimV
VPFPTPRQVARHAAAFLCCAAASAPAWSFGLGNLEVHSALGSPFSATIAVDLQAGEQLPAECVRTDPSRRSDGGVPLLSGARLALEKGGQKIRVTTSQAVNEPAVRFWVQIDCAALGHVSREYVALLDPPSPPSAQPVLPVAAAPPPATPAKVPRASGKTAVDTWTVKAGETLSGIAHDIHPWNTALQKKLARAIVEANPDKFDPQHPNGLKAGMVLKIPQLAGAPTTQPLPPPAAAPKTATAKTATASVAKAGKPLVAASAQKPAEDFRLKLAAPEDKTAARETPAADAAATAATVAASDDQAARLLALSNQVGQLESYLADTRKQLAQVERELKQVRTQPPPPPPDNSGWIAAVIAALFGGGLGTYLFLRHGQALRSLLARRFRKSPTPLAEEPLPYQAQPRLVPKQEADLAGDMEDGRNAITVSFSDSLPDDTNQYLSRDMSDQTLAAMEKHVVSAQHDAAPWLTLLGIYADRAMAERFDNLAQQFKQTFDMPEQWQQVCELGKKLDPANPLYAGPDGKDAEDLDFDSLLAPQQEATEETTPSEPTDLDQTLILRAPLDLEVALPMEETLESAEHLDIELTEVSGTGEEALPPLDLPLEEGLPAEEQTGAEPQEGEDDVNLLDIPLEFTLPTEDSAAGEAAALESDEGAPLEMIELPPLEMDLPPTEKPAADEKA